MLNANCKSNRHSIYEADGSFINRVFLIVREFAVDSRH